MAIKILQWNVLYTEKISGILKNLKKINADILCLQELTINSPYNKSINIPKLISEELNLHYYFEPASKPSTNQSGLSFDIGNGIFSKHPIKKAGFETIHESAQSVIDGPDREPRIYIEAKVKIADKVLKVGTTHLSYTPYFEITKWRERQTSNLINVIKNHRNKYVLCGDFNAAPDSSVIKRVEKYLKSCGPDHKESTWTTKPFDLFGFKEDKLRWRLDYVFSTQDIVVKSSKILKTKYSDHLPILTEIEI